MNGKVKYPCNKCGNKFARKADVKNHNESVHEKVKYPCDQWEHKATTQGNLKNHIESIHLKVNYPCNICDKLFTAKSEETYFIRP